MSSPFSSLQAHGVLLANSAANIANLNTPDYHPRRTTLVEGHNQAVTAVTQRSAEPDNVDLARQIGDLKAAERGYTAALRAITVREEMLDDLMHGFESLKTEP